MVPKDEQLKKLGYRILVVGKYLVLYAIKGKTVQIRRIHLETVELFDF
jgi:hypothetical protein